MRVSFSRSVRPPEEKKGKHEGHQPGDADADPGHVEGGHGVGRLDRPEIGLEKHEGQILEGDEEAHRDEDLHERRRIEDGLDDEPLHPHAHTKRAGATMRIDR